MRALWVSTSRRTRGGIAGYVEVLAGTRLWTDWRIEHLVTHVDGPPGARVAVFARALVRLAIVLIGHRPDLLHVHTASRGSFARKAVVVWMAAIARVPAVLHVHGGGFDRFHDGSARPVRALIRATLHRADRVLALGEGWADRLARIAPRARIVVFPNPVAAAEPVDHGTGPVRVLFAGRLGPVKGVDVLLDAWASLRPASARLELAGDGDRDGVRRRIAELGIESGVDVRGWLSRERLFDAMASAHVLVLPSRVEGQPMAVLEAMAHGLCVVATEVGGVPDLVSGGVTGLLVPPADPAALAAALRRVLDDPTERARLGAAGRQWVRARHDSEVAADRLDRLYREVLRDHRASTRPPA